jgi:aspartyl-tRNA(Asn)/glutamyl-tRNA(Gln) amidotransferase subunit A
MSSSTGWKGFLPDHCDAYGRLVRETDAALGSFLELDPARRAAAVPESPSDSPLAGVPFAVKDNIAVRGFQLSCGSRILGDHVAPYDATVVGRLIEAGMVPVGKTNLDEFGMGSSCDNSALGQTNNPWDPSRVPGGSSGGSAAAVAAGLVPVALGSDTGGSVRQPAAFCGVYGLKPTYGMLSRYGLVAYASSLETVGILGMDPGIIRDILATAAGVDERDQTSITSNAPGGPQTATTADQLPARVAFLAGDLDLDGPTRDGYLQFREAVKSLGVEVQDIDLSTTDVAISAYYTIATAEASANLARFNGIRYGERPIFAENPEELVRKARSEGFGPEVLQRILLGTYVLRSGFQEQYYQRAQKIRTAVRNELDGVFSTHDLLILPTFPTVAFPHGEAGLSPFQQKLADRFTTIANLAAVPALSIPAGVHGGLPVGIQAMGPARSEERLLSFAEALATKLPVARPPEYQTTVADRVLGGEGA